MPKGVYKRKPFTDNHRNNIGLAKRGISKNLDYLNTPEMIEKRIAPLRGIKRNYLSDEARIKMSEGSRKRFFGRKLTLSHRKKISEAGKRRVENGTHNNYKGGITPLAKQIRECFQSRQWRSDVFTRDDFTCQECWAKSGNGKAVYLEAHHIKGFAEILDEYQIKTLEQALNCEELWNINNGRTFCRKCHNKTKKGNTKK